MDNTKVETHYRFGKNWAKYAPAIEEPAIREAQRGLARLLPNGEIAGKRFLDIGCGSGLHSLAAVRRGASRVDAFDIDPESAATTEQVLTRFARDGAWRVNVASVFDLPAEPRYDVVYSWGVLHHTGDMRRAVSNAAAKVSPGGYFCVALYRRTPLCWAWRIEKRVYSRGGPAVRGVLERMYVTVMRARLRASGQRLRDYSASYVGRRVMDFMTDVRDWLGGYPYESISEGEMLRWSGELGLDPVRRFCEKPGWGVTGTGCDEYVLRRPADSVR